MRNFQNTFETRKRSFISVFSILLTVPLRKIQTLRANNSRILRIQNAKFSGYYFHMNTNIWRDFQICISVPLRHHHKVTTRFIFSSLCRKNVKFTSCQIRNKSDQKLQRLLKGRGFNGPLPLTHVIPKSQNLCSVKLF